MKEVGERGDRGERAQKLENQAIGAIRENSISFEGGLIHHLVAVKSENQTDWKNGEKGTKGRGAGRNCMEQHRRRRKKSRNQKRHLSCWHERKLDEMVSPISGGPTKPKPNFPIFSTDESFIRSHFWRGQQAATASRLYVNLLCGSLPTIGSIPYRRSLWKRGKLKKNKKKNKKEKKSSWFPIFMFFFPFLTFSYCMCRCAVQEEYLPNRDLVGRTEIEFQKMKTSLFSISSFKGATYFFSFPLDSV